MWNPRQPRPGMGNAGAHPAFWGQWDSHYGPMQRRVTSRRHQMDALFAPTYGYRMAARPVGPPMPNLMTSFSTTGPVLRQPPRVGQPAPVINENPAMSDMSLYYDFNGPPKPNSLSIRCAVQSIQADLHWNAPRISKDVNFVYKIHITGDSKGETVLEYASWKTNATISLEPGNWYQINVEAVSAGKVLAAGEVSFKSILCAAEMALLQMKAISHLQTQHSTNQMQEIIIFYRNKPPDYWNKIRAYDGVMRPYLKDQCGNPGSPINGEINGLFFAARLQNGLLPTSSPFGGQRLKLLCPRLFLPETHNIYFGDFYCNTHVHYVTVVICIKNSAVDSFCRDKLDQLDPFDNMYLHLRVDDFGNYRYYINNNVWVEVYYTGEVPLWWGEFDYTISMGQSKPNGIPNNKFCKLCNLYPLELPQKPEVSVESLLKSAKRTREDDKETDDVTILPQDAATHSPDAKKSRRHDWVPLELLRYPLADDASSTFHVLVEMVRKGMSPLLPADKDVVQHEEALIVSAEALCEVLNDVVEKVDAQTMLEMLQAKKYENEESKDDPAKSLDCKVEKTAKNYYIPFDNKLTINVPPSDNSTKRLSDVEERKFVDKILAEYGDVNDDDLKLQNQSNIDLIKFEFSDSMQENARPRPPSIDGVRAACVEIEAKTNMLNENLLQLKLFMKGLEKKFSSLV